MDRASLRALQAPLKEHYRTEPDAALVTLAAIAPAATNCRSLPRLAVTARSRRFDRSALIVWANEQTVRSSTDGRGPPP